jgi:hypothetical protein
MEGGNAGGFPAGGGGSTLPAEVRMPREPEEPREETPRNDQQAERETYERYFGEEEEGARREGQAPEEAPARSDPWKEDAGGDREIG